MVVFFSSSSPYHQSSSINFCLAFSKFELCILIFTDGFATLFSFFNIFQCFINSTLCDTYGLSTDTDTTAAQSCHSDLVALTFFAQQVFFGNSYVFIDYFTVGSSSDTHTFDVGTNCQTFVASFYDESGHTFRTFGFVCQSEYDEDISKTGVCCEHLCTVQYIVVAIQCSFCTYASSVCTSTGFCQTKAADLGTVNQRSQIFLFLFFCTKFIDTRAAKRCMYGQCDTCGSINFGHFFHAQCVCQNVCTLTAIFSGIRNTERTDFLQFLQQFSRVFFFFVHVLCDGFNFCFSKFSEQLLLKHLSFCQFEIHLIFLLFFNKFKATVLAPRSLYKNNLHPTLPS